MRQKPFPQVCGSGSRADEPADGHLMMLTALDGCPDNWLNASD